MYQQYLLIYLLKKRPSLMKNLHLCLLLYAASIIHVYSQPFITTQAPKSLSFYLPAYDYNPSIPTPQSVLGYEVGEWHVSHDQLLTYMYAIAQASDRAQLVKIGASYEGRPVVQLIFTSKENHDRLDEIRRDHVMLSDPQNSSSLNIEEVKPVVWMGYSIHGNEPSGSNASLLAAYHLAACQDPSVTQILDDMVILLDPCYNPDGMHRFSTWANMHRGINLLVTDPNNREFNEVWPGGRTNHFWFDLNRDWLTVQHPESQARIKQFHTWKPNFLTDHHEMGTNSTFFFQPGIPSRNYPLTPEKVYDLTYKMADYHAQYLDSIGSLYYAEEGYDDFFIGKGSAYPDINGCVGILFEQASSRGHAQQSDHGVLTFPFTIRNQFTTTLSTLAGTHALRKEFLQHQSAFYTDALAEANQDVNAAYVFTCPEDPSRSTEFLRILLSHDIQVYNLNNDLMLNGAEYTSENSYVIPLRQPQYRLVKGIFDRRTTFNDSLFYDVSAWTVPLALNVEYEALGSGNYNSSLLGEPITDWEPVEGSVMGGQSEYAYIFKWDGYYAPKALYEIQHRGIRTKVSTRMFTSVNGVEFSYGSILIPVVGQDLAPEDLYQLMNKVARENGITIYTVPSGLNTNGIDLGSRNFEPLEKPKILMIVGEGVSGYDAGEVWHLLDQRYHIPVTMVGASDFSRVKLADYNTLVLVNGNYQISDNQLNNLRTWVRGGGNIVAMRGALRWLSANNLGNVKFKASPGVKYDSTKMYPFDNRSNVRGAQEIGGSIFEVQLDLSHPIAFGYHKDRLSVFRNTELFLEPSSNPYLNPVKYTKDPLLAGYISPQNLSTLSGSAAVQVSSLGRGNIIMLVDNPNFRAFWWGTNKLFANSIFFGSVM